jgi:sporulation protein YlmC with PRC-barrel domain
MADLEQAASPMAGVIAASAVCGTDAYDPAGEKLGSIREVMLNETSEKIEFVILNFGGHFVGVNQRYYPLPWRLLKFDKARQGYVVNIDREKLEAAPTCELSDTGVWLGDGSGEHVNAYYGTMSV